MRKEDGYAAQVKIGGNLARNGECSSTVEHWTVAPRVVGSNPITHPVLRVRKLAGTKTRDRDEREFRIAPDLQ